VPRSPDRALGSGPRPEIGMRGDHSPMGKLPLGCLAPRTCATIRGLADGVPAATSIRPGRRRRFRGWRPRPCARWSKGDGGDQPVEGSRNADGLVDPPRRTAAPCPPGGPRCRRGQALRVASNPATWPMRRPALPGQFGHVGVIIMGEHRCCPSPIRRPAGANRNRRSTTARSPRPAATGERRAEPGRTSLGTRSRGRPPHEGVLEPAAEAEVLGRGRGRWDGSDDPARHGHEGDSRAATGVDQPVEVTGQGHPFGQQVRARRPGWARWRWV